MHVGIAILPFLQLNNFSYTNNAYMVNYYFILYSSYTAIYDILQTSKSIKYHLYDHDAPPVLSIKYSGFALFGVI